jgi:conjugal transfer/entry exclusion protein
MNNKLEDQVRLHTIKSLKEVISIAKRTREQYQAQIDSVNATIKETEQVLEKLEEKQS